MVSSNEQSKEVNKEKNMPNQPEQSPDTNESDVDVDSLVEDVLGNISEGNMSVGEEGAQFPEHPIEENK